MISNYIPTSVFIDLYCHICDINISIVHRKYDGYFNTKSV